MSICLYLKSEYIKKVSRADLGTTNFFAFNINRYKEGICRRFLQRFQ